MTVTAAHVTGMHLRPGLLADSDAGRARRRALKRAAADPNRFARTFHLLREDDSSGLMDPTDHQQSVLDAIQQHRFVLVVKYRQAYVSTVALAWLLGQIEYGDGLQGIFMAEKRETAESVFRRAYHAYRHQPDFVRVPASRAGLRGLEFAHDRDTDNDGGLLKVMTAGSGTPAIGEAVSRGVFTEFGFWRNQRRVVGHLFPTFLKRPNARIIGESTPGAHNCGYHKLVTANWQVPGARYHVMFLPWWRDPTCIGRDEQGAPLDTRDLVPDQEELRLIDRMPGITTGHLMMRRQLLAVEFDGDVRLFENKYPTDALSGWYTTKNPAFPEEHLKAMLGAALTDYAVDQAWDEPIPGHKYLIAADPNSYGRAGDPSAHTIIDVTDRVEVGAWSGRIDPVAYAGQLARLGRWFNNADIAIEANAAACVTALVLTGYKNVWRSDRNPDHPGWYRTAHAKERAHGAFVRQIRDGRLSLRSREGIQQCLSYDGDLDQHGTEQDDEERHHFDRVAAYLIAADILDGIPAPREVRPLFDPLTHQITVAGIKALDKVRERRARQRV